MAKKLMILTSASSFTMFHVLTATVAKKLMIVTRSIKVSLFIVVTVQLLQRT